VMAVLADPAPLAISARSDFPVVTQGHQLNVNVGVTRRAGFAEAVAVTSTDLPPNMAAGTISVAKDATTAVLPLFVPRNVPPGTYTFAIRGTGAYPFSKDPKAKPKPNINLTEPANPIALTVRPAPLSLTVDNKGGAVKQAASLEIGVTIGRQHGFAGRVAVTLVAPGNLKLAADPAIVADSQTQTRLLIKAAKDSPPGAAALVFVRAAVTISGQVVDVEEPLGLTINKP